MFSTRSRRALLVSGRLRNTAMGGDSLLPSPARHAFVACLAVAFLACAGHLNAQTPSRPEALLGKMTLDEKIGQLVQRAGGRSKALNSRLDDAELARVRAGGVGSYLHVAGAEPLSKLQKVAVEESRLGIPLLFAMDVVHGYRTIFPVPLAMASSWAPESQERAARIAADEATSAGLHWTFAPMVDIARDPRWGRIVESAGEDPYLGSRMAVAQVAGYQGGNALRPGSLMATAKHFGAYGAAVGGRDYNSADISERTLQEVYLPPFFAAARAGLRLVHGRVQRHRRCADHREPRTAARAAARALGLAGSHGVGLGLDRRAAQSRHRGRPRGRRRTGARSVGRHGHGRRRVCRRSERTPSRRTPSRLKLLDEAVLRILRVKEQLGLFDKPMQYHDVEREARELLAPEHRETARAVARQSIVLLKNDGKLLPLDPNRLKTVAVIGQLATDGLSQLGSWRAQGKADDVVTILKGITAAAPKNLKILSAPGADPRNNDLTGIPAAVKLAKSADVTVLVIGEDFDMSGESRSRSSIELPPSQRELAMQVLATGKPVVVVLSNGRPLAIPELAEKAPAILETWMLGVEAGHAVADVLFGKYSPAGRLPAAFPRATGAVPFNYSANATGRPADPDLAKDTVRYHDLPITPLYPFGHGLTYSEFRYKDLVQSVREVGPGERIDISITVENIGGVAIR